jgi:aminoglycoside/choline kinase family phosphotransferase
VRSTCGPAQLELLPPHASLRRYVRAKFADHAEIALLNPPAGGPADEVGQGARVPLAEDPFVVVRAWLERVAVRVPALHAIDAEGDILWLEDAGRTDLDTALAEGLPRRDGYRMALAALQTLQKSIEQTAPPTCVTTRSFDRDLLRWELEHYLEWRVEAQLGVRLAPGTREALGAEFDALADRVAAIPTTVMHRDFQSHNLMVTDGQIVVLDFQDAMVGPLVYDAVALLRDSYVALDDADLDTLVGEYAAAASTLRAADGATASDIRSWFDLQTVQRKLKDSGRFVYIDRVKQNPSFLRYIDGSVAYVRTALARRPELSRLATLLAEVDPGLR